MKLKQALIWISGVSLLASTPVFAQKSAAQPPDSVRYPCRNVHGFDYWAGTFDTKPWDKPDAPSGGQLVNTREYDGCVFVERFTSPGGSGMSMVFYDLTRKTWRMVWNDDGNGSNVFDEGTLHDGSMRFTGWMLNPKGVRVMTSNTLERVGADVIHHTFAVSPDSGKSWIVRSSTRFVRVAGSGSH